MNNQVSKGSVEPQNTHTAGVKSNAGINLSNLASVDVESMDIDLLSDCIRYIGEQYHSMVDAEKDIALKFLSDCEGSVCLLCRSIKELGKKCKTIKTATP